MSFTQQDVQSAYRSILGRDASDAEINSFMPFANTGSVNLSPLNIQQIIQATPEYQQQNLMRQGNVFSDTLAANDTRMMGIAGARAAQGIASSGRSLGGSGYVNAFANAAANLAMQRQQSLANFYGQGFGQINANAMNQGNASQDFGQGEQQSTVGWNRQLSAMATYKSLLDAQRYAAQRQSTFGAIGTLGGTALGAIGGGLIGGKMGAVGGAMGGAQIGGSVGQAFGR